MDWATVDRILFFLLLIAIDIFVVYILDHIGK